jgi:hypothetical protein
MLLMLAPVAARSKLGMAFESLEIGIVGSNPVPDMDVCPRFLCCAVLCVRRADPPPKESY